MKRPERTETRRPARAANSATPSARALLAQLRSRLSDLADPERAAQMQAYMKSSMPYHGVPMPVTRKVAKEVLADVRFDAFEPWRDTVLGLWRGARFREEWYAAMVLTGLRSGRSFQTPEAMTVYEPLIVEGAWWDVVDDVAANRVGPILRSAPSVMVPLLRKWSTDENLWRRRTAILAQLKFKDATDVELLFELMEPSVPSKEFFLRKAIGWALREYARTDPAAVSRYVQVNRGRLSGLSVREALKHIPETAVA